MRKILITGSTGFVGRELTSCLVDKGFNIAAAVRRRIDSFQNSDLINEIFVGDLLPDTDWSNALLDVEVIIHLSARVHVMQESCTDPLSAFRFTNATSTLSLARQAADAGVHRFIFLSTIKVNGESTPIGQAFRPDDSFVPSDPYGLSKYEAEQGLMEISKTTGMEVVIIRPP